MLRVPYRIVRHFALAHGTNRLRGTRSALVFMRTSEGNGCLGSWLSKFEGSRLFFPARALW
jgi:hypothetical protein